MTSQSAVREKPKALDAVRPVWARPLDEREWRFVEEYLVDLNASAAFRRSNPNYTGKQSDSLACLMMRRPHVQEAIDGALASRFSITKASILEHLSAVAFAEPGDYADWDSTTGLKTKASRLLSKHQRRAIQSVEETESTVGVGKRQKKVRRTRIRLYSKPDALEKLAKVTGILRELPEASSGGTVVFIIEGPDSRPVTIEGQAVDVTPTTGDAKLVIES